jgi:hypothetical protein
MTTTAARPEIRDVARQLVADNLEAEPAIRAVYLFPSGEQIRLVYLDPTTSPNRDEETVRPFYFGPSVAGDRPYPLAVALIRPEERGRLQPPAGWGAWDEAELLWEA